MDLCDDLVCSLFEYLEFKESQSFGVTNKHINKLFKKYDKHQFGKKDIEIFLKYPNELQHFYKYFKNTKKCTIYSSSVNTKLFWNLNDGYRVLVPNRPTRFSVCQIIQVHLGIATS